MKTPIAISAAVALLAANVAAAPPAWAADKPTDKPAARNECFWTRNVTSFAAPDDRTVYIRVNMHDVYKFDLMVSCPGVDWRQSLALKSVSGSVCNGMDAEIISHAPGLGRMRCPISHMHKLTPEEIAALPKRARP
jgi:hypothetical protein